MKWCEIFRAGTHKDSNGNERSWTVDDLNTIKSNFETVNPDVPICCGHVKTNSPAYGWVDKMRISGEKLYASFKDVVPEFANAVRQGLYKTRSISLTRDLVPRHIAFLGAQAPAIKGMEQFCFSSDEMTTIEFSIDRCETEQRAARGNTTMPPQNGLDPKGDNMSDLEKLCAEKDAEIKKLQDELAQKNSEALKKEYEEFCDSAISEGHILPVQRQYVLDILFANTDANINFEDGTVKEVNKVFKDFIKSLKQMDFEEQAVQANADIFKDVNFSDAQAVKEAILSTQKDYFEKGITLNPAEALAVSKLKSR